MLRQLSRGNASLMHNFLDIIAPTSELPTFVQVSHDSVSHFSKTLNRVRRRALELKLLLFLARLKIDAAREFTQLPLCSLMLSFSDRELNVNKHLQTRRNSSQKLKHTKAFRDASWKVCCQTSYLASFIAVAIFNLSQLLSLKANIDLIKRIRIAICDNSAVCIDRTNGCRWKLFWVCA